MIKKAILFAITYFILFSAKGQFLKVGIKTLPGVTNTYIENAKNSPVEIKPRFTFNYGVYGAVKIIDSLLFLETGFYNANRGSFSSNAPFFGVPVNLYVNNLFWSIPILARLEKKQFYISLGPTIELYRKTIYRFDGNLPDEEIIFPRLGVLGENFGIILNAGYQWQIAKSISLVTEISLNPSSIYEDSFGNLNYYKTANFGLGVQYNFFKKEEVKQPIF